MYPSSKACACVAVMGLSTRTNPGVINWFFWGNEWIKLYHAFQPQGRVSQTHNGSHWVSQLSLIRSEGLQILVRGYYRSVHPPLPSNRSVAQLYHQEMRACVLAQHTRWIDSGAREQMEREKWDQRGPRLDTELGENEWEEWLELTEDASSDRSRHVRI